MLCGRRHVVLQCCAAAANGTLLTLDEIARVDYLWLTKRGGIFSFEYTNQPSYNQQRFG